VNQVGVPVATAAIDRVIATNQLIAEKKAYRRTWYGWLLLPSEWDAIEPIAIPAKEPLPVRLQ
jgi:hypothetical protein